MWLKLVLVIIYVAVLFVLARILETVTWVESGNISRRLLDPMAMSVLKLKALLEQRGISYEGAVEKRELSELVESTGSVMEDASVDTSLEEETTVTNFTGGADFLEQVEDSKDSVWIVEVLANGRHISALADTSWLGFRKKMSRFGVNIGVFDCFLDWQFCSKKAWHDSHLILGLPEEFKTKAVVKLYSYEGQYRQQFIFNWIKRTVSKKVQQIQSYQEVEEEWLKFNQSGSNAEVRVVMFSDIKNAPLFFSAVSIKFPGRVKFGIMNNISSKKKDLLKEFDWGIPPRYLVITAEQLSSYGNKPLEHSTFESMEFFLKTLYPSVNDIFVLSLGICNLTTLFEPFLVQGSIVKRLFRLICCIIKHNTILLLTWILLLTVFQLNTLTFIIEFGLKCIRMFGVSELGSYIRQDYCFYAAHKYFNGISFLVYVAIVGILAYRFKDHEAEEFNPNEWNFAQFRTLQHLFYPTASLFLASQRRRFIDYEDNPVDLSLFHASMTPTDYIRNLPIWNHKVLPVVSFIRGIARDARSDSDTADMSSDNQNEVVPVVNYLDRPDQKEEEVEIGTTGIAGTKSEKCTAKEPETTDKSEILKSDQQTEEETCTTTPLQKSKNANPKQNCDVDLRQAGVQSGAPDGRLSGAPDRSLSKAPDGRLSGAPDRMSSEDPEERLCGAPEGRMSEAPEGRLSDAPMWRLCGAPEGMLVESQCVICLDDYEDNAKLCGLPCGHCFHQACILAWLIKDNHFCPFCRWPAFQPKQASIHLHQE